MSHTSPTHSSSTLSSSSSSTSPNRQSYPSPTRRDPTHHHRRNIHSAPAAYKPFRTLNQTSTSTLSSSSSTDSSTAVPSSSDDEKPIKPTHLSPEDESWANKITAEHAAKTEASAKREMAKAKRGCMGALASEFDFGYANVASRGARSGRRAPGLGKCELM